MYVLCMYYVYINTHMHVMFKKIYVYMLKYDLFYININIYYIYFLNIYVCIFIFTNFYLRCDSSWLIDLSALIK